MMECRDTGLPMNNTEVFKAFCAWRTNAKDFAELSGLDKDKPVHMAQLINAVNPEYTRLMTLAMLLTVAPAALTPIEKRFGPEIVATIDEHIKHVATGYAYLEQATDEVKGIAMATGIMAFDQFIAKVDKMGDTLSLSDFGKEPAEVLRDLLMPECRAFERLADKMDCAAYPALEDMFHDRLFTYRAARAEQEQMLGQMGIQIDDAEAQMDSRRAPFETQGLLDAPEVRQAYDVLMHDARVTPDGLANALSTARLLCELPEEKDPAVIAAGMIYTGLSRRAPQDGEFLAKKLGGDVMHILDTYDLPEACTESAEPLREAPPAVRQLAVAMGIILLDAARQQSEKVMDFVDMRGKPVPEQVEAQIKAKSLLPLRFMSAAVPNALSPLMGITGSRQLEQLFDAQVKDAKNFISAHMPVAPAAGTAGRMRGSGKPSGPEFGL